MSATSGISNFITGGASSLSQISGALGGADFMMEMQGVQKEMQQNRCGESQAGRGKPARQWHRRQRRAGGLGGRPV